MNIFIYVNTYIHTPRCTYTHTCVDIFLEVKLPHQRECRFGVEIAKVLSKMIVPVGPMQQNSWWQQFALCQESSFAEHSREEGVRVSDGGEETVGSLPLQAVCGGICWPLALPGCCVSQEEETQLCVLTSACSPGCDRGAGHVHRMCVCRSAGPDQPLISENVGLESSFPAWS